jgi:queuine tRNA-ribosyltransferase
MIAFPQFRILHETPHGRLGAIQTAHGNVLTPAFVFCGTKCALKACWPGMARDLGMQIMLSNTYHILVNSDPAQIDRLGGLQEMTGWRGPMMTDSGGYQIFAMGCGSVSQELKGVRNTKSSLLSIAEEGVRFKSYRDGSEIFLTPEKSIQTQIECGADLIFVLDECTAFNIDKSSTEAAMLRSHRWEERSVQYFNTHKKQHQGIYSIVQGGIYDDLRAKSVDFANNLDTFGIGIGGSLGKDLSDMNRVLNFVLPKLKRNCPRHLLGIGTIEAILMAVPYGIDTFDCVYPTRLGRHGGAWIADERIAVNIKNAKYRSDERPLDAACSCTTCKTFSRAYLHFLFKAKETLGIMALTAHNIAFINNFMSSIREAIFLGPQAWSELKNGWTKGEKK